MNEATAKRVGTVLQLLGFGSFGLFTFMVAYIFGYIIGDHMSRETPPPEEDPYEVVCSLVTEENWQHPNLASTENRPRSMKNMWRIWGQLTVRERCLRTLNRVVYSTVSDQDADRVVPCVHGGVAKGCVIYNQDAAVKMVITDPISNRAVLWIYTDEDMARIAPHLVLLE
jgi:hypothetical protein